MTEVIDVWICLVLNMWGEILHQYKRGLLHSKGVLYRDTLDLITCHILYTCILYPLYDFWPVSSCHSSLQRHKNKFTMKG